MVKKNEIQSINVVITIDLSRLTADLRSMISREIEIDKDVTETKHTQDPATNNITSPEGKNDLDIITLSGENDIGMIKQRLKDILIKNRIGDFVAMVDLEDQNKIIIIKKEHAQTLGVHHCPHCGIEFENEIQLSVHQRIHYIV